MKLRRSLRGSQKEDHAVGRKLAFQRVRDVSVFYLLMMPTIVGMLLFTYWPKLDIFRYSFFRWEPDAIEEWVGFQNFIDAFYDSRFRSAFFLVFLLLAANLVKMLPSLLSAIVLHRLASDRLRYFFQVCFVVPMVVPGLIWLLLWKGFMDPNVGLINGMLNATGWMAFLNWLDSVMYQVADALYPIAWGLDWAFSGGAAQYAEISPLEGYARSAGSGSWGLMIFGAALLIAKDGWRQALERWYVFLPLILSGIVIWGDRSLIWLLALAIVAHLSVKAGLRFAKSRGRLRIGGWSLVVVALVILVLTQGWDHRIGAFEHGNPAWLGHSDLIVPALMFWGFPWVHAVGVLIYLAGLQQISTDVYEAAELDGLGSLGKALKIELPLIMTQVRINLIFMTIATLNGYGFFLVLLGPDGGPGGKGMVPGLYMYQQAFSAGKFGYACALGLVMFAIILALTLVYQRYVKVDK